MDSQNSHNARENPFESVVVKNPEADFGRSYAGGFYVVSGEAGGWYLAVTADGQFQFYLKKPEDAAGGSELPDDFEPLEDEPGRTLGKIIEDAQLIREMRSWKFSAGDGEPSVIPKEEAGPVSPQSVSEFFDRLEERRKTSEFRAKVVAAMELLKEES